MNRWYEESFGEDYLRVYKHRNAESAENEMNQVIEWLGLTKDELILDMCCGAGRHTIALARKQFYLVGFDLSKVLLSKAQEDAGELPISFVLGDMRAMPFVDDSFHVILNLFTSFGYFPTDEDNQKVFAEIARVLKPGGRFLIDYINHQRVKENLVPFSEREENGMRIAEKRFIEHEFVCKEICIEDEKGERHYHERVRMYTEYEMRKMMEDAGLSIENVRGNFDGEELHAQSERIIFIGKAGKE